MDIKSNFDELWQHVAVLSFPQQHSKELYERAQAYCDTFKSQNTY
jgi:hypothetical protein